MRGKKKEKKRIEGYMKNVSKLEILGRGGGVFSGTSRRRMTQICEQSKSWSPKSFGNRLDTDDTPGLRKNLRI